MGFTDCFVKYALFFLNFTTTIIGVFYIVLSTYINLYLRTLFYDDDVEIIADLLINFIYLSVMGSLIFMITFMGCCGALAEKPCLLNIYALIMLILSAVMIIFMVIFHSLLSGLEYIFESLERVYEMPLFVTTLRFIEASNQCCGTTGADSYESLSIELPPTCCPGLEFPRFAGFESLTRIQYILANYNRTELYCTLDTSYEGCISIITEIINFLYHLASNVTILTIAIELIAAIFAFYLAQHIRNEIATKKSPKSYILRVKD